jgi:DNA-binding transcriptional regulator YdaS (Cro superfamily)
MYPLGMKLSDWINSHPKEARLALRKNLAKKLGISEVYVRSMANGNKPIPLMMALEIQQYTRGKVSISDSCPKFAAKLSRTMEATA